MSEEPLKPEIKLDPKDVTYLAPTVPYDGNFWAGADLVFYQRGASDDPKAVRANIVSAIRFSSIDQLKDLIVYIKNKVREMENPED